MKILINSQIDSTIKNHCEAIRYTGQKLLDQGWIKKEYIDACIDREVNYPTGLMMANGIGIAIPHADHNLVNEDCISVLKSVSPVEFGNMEDSNLKVNCNLIFNLAFSTGDKHIKILRKLFSLFQDSNFIEKLTKLDDLSTQSYLIDLLKIKN